MPAQDVLVIGLGYVGLPLAVQAVRAGFRVTGYDTSARIVEGLNAGRSHVDDVGDDEIAAMRAKGFRATAADLVILLQAHQHYDLAQIARTARLLLDTRGVVPKTPAVPHVEAL